jgi:DNA-binding beta-propeller fold protein YncE
VIEQTARALSRLPRGRTALPAIALAAATLMTVALLPGPARAAVARPATAAPPGFVWPRADVNEFATSSGQITRTFRAGRAPTDIVAAPDGKFVYVANSMSDYISALPVAAAATAARQIHLRGVKVFFDLLMSHDGKYLYAYVAGTIEREPGDYLLMIRTSTMRIVHSADIGVIRGLTLAPDGKTIYEVGTGVTGNQVLYRFAAANLRPERPVTVAGKAYYTDGLVITPNSKLVYVATTKWVKGNPVGGMLTAVLAPTGKVLKRIGIGEGLHYLLATPKGKVVYVGSQSGIVAVSTESNTVIRHIAGPSTAGPMVLAPGGKTVYVGSGLNILPISTTANQAGLPIQLPGDDVAEGNPGTLAVSPDGTTLYVIVPLFPGQGTLIPISTATGTAGAPIMVGLDPERIVLSPNGKYGFVVDENS